MVKGIDHTSFDHGGRFIGCGRAPRYEQVRRVGELPDVGATCVADRLTTSEALILAYARSQAAAMLPRIRLPDVNDVSPVHPLRRQHAGGHRRVLALEVTSDALVEEGRSILAETQYYVHAWCVRDLSGLDSGKRHEAKEASRLQMLATRVHPSSMAQVDETRQARPVDARTRNSRMENPKRRSHVWN
jgi:hypothetical protein